MSSRGSTERKQPNQKQENGPLVPPPVRNVLQTPGKPLDPVTRAWGEPRLGHDLSRVRVHADETAATTAKEIGARAFTAGPHVAFGAGQYRPDTEAGRNLLAHELTHVGQQASPASRDGTALEAEAHARTDAPPAHSPMRAAAPSQIAGVQRFEEHEHRSLGDTATGSASYDIGTAAAPFELTHGDILMLSGDWFLSADLFKFAALPGDKGTKLGTQDEVITALQKAASLKHPDPRFGASGKWHGWTPSKEVSDAVDERFNRLAAANDSHFAAPAGRGVTGPAAPAKLGSAGTLYRKLHEEALMMAYQAGRASGAVTPALAREAAAQHYLTDAFSAGHLRTPIESIRDFWKAKYPLFFYNLLHKIALDTAVRINDMTTNLTTIIGTVRDIYNSIMEQVKAIEKTLPEVTLGDLLARVYHDVDNKEGVDITTGGMVFGDDFLDDPNPRNVTRKLAEWAIQLGNKDIVEAHTLGSAGGTELDQNALDAEVQRVTFAPSPEFHAENKMPRASATAPKQNWTAPDFETLWGTPVTTAAGSVTVGAKIIEELQPGQPIRAKLDGLEKKFDEVSHRSSGDVRPRAAYREGFVNRLVAAPKEGILDIIHWAPDYGIFGTTQDDVALEVAKELGDSSRLAGMTAQARVRYIRTLIDGRVVGEEQEMVIKLFNTAPVAHRQWMYHRIEGHPWSGKLIEGWTVSDDDLWNALSKNRAHRLEKIINGVTEP